MYNFSLIENVMNIGIIKYCAPINESEDNYLPAKDFIIFSKINFNPLDCHGILSLYLLFFFSCHQLEMKYHRHT